MRQSNPVAMPRTMSCRDCLRLLRETRLGDTSPDLETHLRDCPECAREWQLYQGVGADLRAVTLRAAPPELRDRVRRALQAEMGAERERKQKRATRWSPWMLLSGGSALATLMLLFVVYQRAPHTTAELADSAAPQMSPRESTGSRSIGGPVHTPTSSTPSPQLKVPTLGGQKRSALTRSAAKLQTNTSSLPAQAPAGQADSNQFFGTRKERAVAAPPPAASRPAGPSAMPAMPVPQQSSVLRESAPTNAPASGQSKPVDRGAQAGGGGGSAPTPLTFPASPGASMLSRRANKGIMSRADSPSVITPQRSLFVASLQVVHEEPAHLTLRGDMHGHSQQYFARRAPAPESPTVSGSAQRAPAAPDAVNGAVAAQGDENSAKSRAGTAPSLRIQPQTSAGAATNTEPAAPSLAAPSTPPAAPPSSAMSDSQVRAPVQPSLSRPAPDNDNNAPHVITPNTPHLPSTGREVHAVLRVSATRNLKFASLSVELPADVELLAPISARMGATAIVWRGTLRAGQALTIPLRLRVTNPDRVSSSGDDRLEGAKTAMTRELRLTLRGMTTSASGVEQLSTRESQSLKLAP